MWDVNIKQQLGEPAACDRVTLPQSKKFLQHLVARSHPYFILFLFFWEMGIHLCFLRYISERILMYWHLSGWLLWHWVSGDSSVWTLNLFSLKDLTRSKNLYEKTKSRDSKRQNTSILMIYTALHRDCAATIIFCLVDFFERGRLSVFYFSFHCKSIRLDWIGLLSMKSFMVRVTIPSTYFFFWPIWFPGLKISLFSILNDWLRWAIITVDCKTAAISKIAKNSTLVNDSVN